MISSLSLRLSYSNVSKHAATSHTQIRKHRSIKSLKVIQLWTDSAAGSEPSRLCILDSLQHFSVYVSCYTELWGATRAKAQSCSAVDIKWVLDVWNDKQRETKKNMIQRVIQCWLCVLCAPLTSTHTHGKGFVTSVFSSLFSPLNYVRLCVKPNQTNQKYQFRSDWEQANELTGVKELIWGYLLKVCHCDKQLIFSSSNTKLLFCLLDGVCEWQVKLR